MILLGYVSEATDEWSPLLCGSRTMYAILYRDCCTADSPAVDCLARLLLGPGSPLPSSEAALDATFDLATVLARAMPGSSLVADSPKDPRLASAGATLSPTGEAVVRMVRLLLRLPLSSWASASLASSRAVVELEGTAPRVLPSLMLLAAKMLSTFRASDSTEWAEAAEPDAFWCTLRLVGRLADAGAGPLAVDTSPLATGAVFALIESRDVRLASLLTTLHVPHTSLGAGWLSAMGVSVLPESSASRVWDALLGDASNFQLLLCVAAASVLLRKAELGAATSQADALAELAAVHPVDPEQLLELALQLYTAKFGFSALVTVADAGAGVAAGEGVARSPRPTSKGSRRGFFRMPSPFSGSRSKGSSRVVASSNGSGVARPLSSSTSSLGLPDADAASPSSRSLASRVPPPVEPDMLQLDDADEELDVAATEVTAPGATGPVSSSAAAAATETPPASGASPRGAADGAAEEVSESSSPDTSSDSSPSASASASSSSSSSGKGSPRAAFVPVAASSTKLALPGRLERRGKGGGSAVAARSAPTAGTAAGGQHTPSGTDKHGVHEVKGRRVTMEDAHAVSDDLRADYPALRSWLTSHGISDTQRVSCYAVFDGHAGRRAADYLGVHFIPILVDQLLAATPENSEPVATDNPDVCTDYTGFEPLHVEDELPPLASLAAAALHRAFVQVDAAMLAQHEWPDGSTGAVLLMMGPLVLAANCGDAEVVLVQEGAAAECVTLKHKPNAPSERKRIQAAGGFVIFGRVGGTLAVSRAFGDRPFKSPHSQTPSDLVSVSPYISAVLLTDAPRYAIVACDGLFDVFSYEDMASKVDEVLAEDDTPVAVAEAMCSAALDAGSLDNVTVVYVPLDEDSS